MSKYVHVQKLDNGTTKIKLFPANKGVRYKIFFEDNGAIAYFNNLVSEESFLCSSRHEWIKAGSVVHIQFKNYDDCSYQPVYTAVLDNCVWTDDNIATIEKQLVEQADKMEFEDKVAKQIREIEQTIKTKGYSTLIQNLIKKYADELTDDEVMDIQRTLTTVKEDKRLTSRPSIFSSWK